MVMNDALIKKSDENWEVMELLSSSRSKKHLNAAANRMYYSVLHLIFHEMLVHKEITLNGTTGKHIWVVKHLKEKYGSKEGRELEILKSLREKADYSIVPVSDLDFQNVYRKWKEKRKIFYNNVKTDKARVIL